MSDFKVLADLVLSGNVNGIKETTKQYLEQGLAPLDILNKGLMAGMEIVGAKFKKGDMFVPEVMMSAKCMNVGLDIIKPLIMEKDMTSAGIVVLGAVKGDLHDIGKNLVKMMLESSGFKVIDAGIDVSAETFVELVEKHKAQVIGLAALLTTTMLQMKTVIELLEKKGLRNQVKVLIGGAPISEEFAQEIDADGYAADAGAAVAFCRQASAA